MQPSRRPRRTWGGGLAASLTAIVASAVAASGAQPPSCVEFRQDEPDWRAVIARSDSIESTHFIVYFETSGRDSLHSEELPSNLLDDLEFAYESLSSDPRSALPVPFGLYEGADGTRKIPAFLRETSPGYAGHAVMFWVPDFENPPCAYKLAGYVILSCSISNRGTARRAATHELMHLFEGTLNPLAPRWMDESCARWAESFVHPEDNRVVESWGSFVHHTAAPWNPKYDSTIYSPHFWDFLDLRLHDTIPPQVWKRACSTDWFEALRQTLAAHEVGLDEMLHEFARWNYYTDVRDDGAHYEAGPLPLIEADGSFTRFPLEGAAIDEYAEVAASNYLFFSGTATRENLRIILHGSDTWRAHRRVSWIGTTGPHTHVEHGDLDSAAEAFIVPQWHLYDQVAVIVTQGVSEDGVGSEDLRYTVSAVEEGRSVMDLAWKNDMGSVSVTSPGFGGAAIRYRSMGSARRTQLAIYDARGRLVRRLVEGFFPAGAYAAYWDGSNQGGEPAPPGVYLLLMRDGSEFSPRKFILLR